MTNSTANQRPRLHRRLNVNRTDWPHEERLPRQAFLFSALLALPLLSLSFSALLFPFYVWIFFLSLSFCVEDFGLAYCLLLLYLSYSFPQSFFPPLLFLVFILWFLLPSSSLFLSRIFLFSFSSPFHIYLTFLRILTLISSILFTLTP